MVKKDSTFKIINRFEDSITLVNISTLEQITIKENDLESFCKKNKAEVIKEDKKQ